MTRYGRVAVVDFQATSCFGRLPVLSWLAGFFFNDPAICASWTASRLSVWHQQSVSGVVLSLNSELCIQNGDRHVNEALNNALWVFCQSQEGSELVFRFFFAFLFDSRSSFKRCNFN